MFGIALLPAIVLVAVATMLLLWLGAWIDYYREARRLRKQRRQWLGRWRNYKQQHPHARMSSYIRQNEKTDPVKLMYPRHARYEKLFYVFATAAAVLEFRLFVLAFHEWPRGKAEGIVALTVIALVVWFVLVMSESVLPGYARTDYNHHAAVVPIEKEAEYS